jgi:glucokinase
MNALGELVPVLEIGGTHVTSALVAMSEPTPVVVERHRAPLHAEAPAAAIVTELAAAASQIDVEESVAWGVALPGPFDYHHGIGRYEDVGKFDNLRHFDLGAALVQAILPRPSSVRFINDADAFGLGECAAGAGRPYDRAVCLTLGTGVGSAFIDHGYPVNEGPEVPPDGSAHLLRWCGVPLEEMVSRRAIRQHYRYLTGETTDVKEIAERARIGEIDAALVLNTAMRALGEGMAPWIASFGASVVIVGGSISGSWDVLERSLRMGITESHPDLDGVLLRVAELPEDAPLVGAAASVGAASGSIREHSSWSAPSL